MQKLSPAKLRAARALLKEALPGDFSLQAEKGQATVTIQSREAPGLALTLVGAPDQPPAAGTLPVLVLRGTRDECAALRRRGQSFIDLGGEVYLKSSQLYVDRVGLSRATVDPQPPRMDPYGDRASLVIRTLLRHPLHRRWTTSELANAAGVDPSTASRVVRLMRWRELVLDEAPGQGRTSRIGVRDPDALLEDWARRYSWEDSERLRVAAPVGSPSRFLPRMREPFEGVSWALSLQAGASLVAPHATFDVIHVYVDQAPEEVALGAGWDPSSDGKLVLMKPKYSESIWFDQQVIRGIPVVSTVQLVLDLWHYPVRGREQADHIIETILRPVWMQDA